MVLSVEKFRHIAEVSINANGLRINGQEETGDMYSAIDMVVDKVEAQIWQSLFSSTGPGGRTSSPLEERNGG